LDHIQEILLRHWGYSSFRPLQVEIIQSVLAGQDTLALLPTGGGKSVCYQVPALARDGLCLVISPLIALMKDQVEGLKRKKIKAAAVFSGMSKTEIDITLDNCIYGENKFLYLSPERLGSDLVAARLEKMNISLIAVDEAHCISQWGYDFRPPYLKIAGVREFIKAPVIALTATATDEVKADITEKLKFKKGKIFTASFERNNLAYVVLNEENKLQKLISILTKVPGTSIVYVRSRKKTKEIADYLMRNKLSANFYHAGLDHNTRSRIQDEWMINKTRIICATNAFGMGIDKPDVRTVIHLDIPENPEAYFQEAGRAGRDGNKSYAVMLYNKSDILDLEIKSETAFPSIEEIKRTYQALANYLSLAEGAGYNNSYDFEIAGFCITYNFSPVIALNCIHILELEGYLATTESVFLPSRIHITANHDDLYQFQVQNINYDPFIKLLLRSYEGLFDDFVKINENDIASRAGLTSTEVTKLLYQLQKLNLIKYLPKKDIPQVIFTQPRVNTERLIISKKNLADRKQRFEKRINYMKYYITEHNKCRSVVLLDYFGEKESARCGICDVCLERNKLEINDLEFKTVYDQVKELLEASTYPLDRVILNIRNINEEKALKVVKWMIDNQQLAYTKDHMLKWNEKS
jgi:ATP-dependent DNA helicase RecQ